MLYVKIPLLAQYKTQTNYVIWRWVFTSIEAERPEFALSSRSCL